MKVIGFNHVTIRVSDLARSLTFYREVLGMELVHRGRTDAYLEWGEAWVCLIQLSSPRPHDPNALGVDHVAFSIADTDFPDAVRRLREAQVPLVRGPMERGGGQVVNFLDPDGNQLECYTSSLHERMKRWK
ncbi:VOC family protein [Desmospora profundinema]|uniref:Metallothiol transferase n=1 Tax=Desmospora profundinema TaxID=1571184 RepID=A0ABU1INQ4_9BACL|nr:VOC family protein [Desmospora profundinema]MDR6226147.1 metallothiol transferase [Desmospora profundinema]